MIRPPCRKRRFRDKVSADLAIEKIRLHGNDRGGPIPIRAFWHHECRAWHLTHWPLAHPVRTSHSEDQQASGEEVAS